MGCDTAISTCQSFPRAFLESAESSHAVVYGVVVVAAGDAVVGHGGQGVNSPLVKAGHALRNAKGVGQWNARLQVCRELVEVEWAQRRKFRKDDRDPGRCALGGPDDTKEQRKGRWCWLVAKETLVQIAELKPGSIEIEALAALAVSWHHETYASWLIMCNQITM